MSDYFDTEEVVKSYDQKIFRRILGCLKPYSLLMAAALIALAVSTLGELIIPVIQQQVIDRHIVVRFLVLRQDLAKNAQGISAGSLEELEKAVSSPGVLEAGGRAFIRLDRKLSLSSRAETEFRDKGILDEEDWYAFEYLKDSPAAGAVEKSPSFFLLNEEPSQDRVTAAIRKKDLYSLAPEEIAAIRSGDIAVIIQQVILIFAVLLLVFVFTFIQTWSVSLIGQKVMKDIRLELFSKTTSQSTAFLSRHPVGRLVTRLTGDVETINEFFNSVLAAFLKDLSIMTGAMITLFVLSPKLALAVLAALPPVLAITALSRVKARDAFRRQRVASSRVNSYLSERLSGVQIVQLFGGEKKSAKDFLERNRELLNANLGEMYVFATFRPLVEWFATLAVSIVIVAGSVMVLHLSVSLGVLIAFINLIGLFFNPLMDIAEKYTLLQSAMAGGEWVFTLMDTKEQIPDKGVRRIEGAVRGHIEFDDVRFAYKTGEDVLRGLSFTVNPGEMAAIVGYTGAGKTTITNVLTRLWDIQGGGIRLDGVPVQNIPLQELRRTCLPVLQDVFLFSGTVAENISLGLPLPEAAIEEAAKAVHAHEFISCLKEGYRTVLSEGAANISSGQRQLISFARVIAHNPAVVILDEATSSIDTETERLIQMGIQRVLAGRTSIVIAHRLSTIRSAHRILVLSGGRVAEEGRHDELIAKNGLYAGLYRLQYQEES
ncbi:MAG: ABC transporter ATP-binding protein/permease [Treponema sp.]|nr:ABC transporter ATP-binding protein/permease [Treponema sp.]